MSTTPSLRFPRLYKPETAEELLTRPILGKLMLGFAAALRMAVAMQDRRGNRYELFGHPEEHFCPFCRKIRLDYRLEEKCKQWDSQVANGLLEDCADKRAEATRRYGEPFLCHAGMVDFAEPILLEGRLFALLHGGQVRPDYSGWKEEMRRRLTSLFPQQEQVVQLLVGLAEQMPPETDLKGRHNTFRAFAREVEDLLGQVYQQRRAASEESLLKAVLEALTEKPVAAWRTLWDSLGQIMAGITMACDASRMILLLSSPGRPTFELEEKARSTPGPGSPICLNIGPYWQAIRHRPVLLTEQSWARQLRETVGLGAEEPCALATFQCKAEAPDTQSPGVLLCVGPEVSTPSVLAFLARLADEIGRCITAVSNSFQVKDVLEKSSAAAAYGVHDVKFPLHAAFGLAERICYGMKRANVQDAELLAQARQLVSSLDEAKKKTKPMEKLPLRDLVVECLLQRQDVLLLVDRTIELARNLRPNKNVGVSWVERPASAVFINADEPYLSTALHAIFENAVKYSFADKQVRVSMKLEGDWFVLRISDYGVGIPPETELRLFEFAVRAQVEETHKRDDRSGAGRGLAIAKRIIQAHHGDLWLTSTPTKGSSSPDDYLHHEVSAYIKLPLSRQR
jgi:signal transduction histidine kinase/ligand-binding sensor protein